MDLVQNGGVLSVGNETDGQSLGSKSTSSSYSVQVLIGLVWHIVVDDDVDLLNVDTSAKKIRAYHDSELALLELVVDKDTLVLRHGSVAGYGWETLVSDDLVEHLGPLLVLDENNDLIEVKLVEQVNELSVLLVVLKIHIVLLETVKGQLRLAVDKELKWVSHVHLASLLRLVSESGREHHNLPILRVSAHEDLLHLSSHVWLIKHLVALIENEHLLVIAVQGLVLHESKDSSWSSDHDVWGLESLEDLDVLLDGHASIEHFSSNVWHIFGESVEFVLNLVTQLSGVAQDQSSVWLWVLLKLMQDREDEDGSLAHS